MTKEKQKLLELNNSLGLQNNDMALLLDPVLRSTVTAKEKTDEFNRSNQIIIPNTHKNIVVTGEDQFTSTVTTISNGTTTDNINHLPINNLQVMN